MSENSETELKPCPWCEGTPELHDTCEDLENAGTGDYYHTCACGIVTGLSSSEEEAIAAWNRRPSSSRRVALEEAAAIASAEAGRWEDESAVMACEDIAGEICSLISKE